MKTRTASDHTVRTIPTPPGFAQTLSLRSELRLKKSAPPIPAGWDTLRDLAKREGVSICTARRIATECIAIGILETKKWPQPDTNGRILNYLIYRRTGQ